MKVHRVMIVSLVVAVGSSRLSGADTNTMPQDPLRLVDLGIQTSITADFYQTYDASDYYDIHTGVDVFGLWAQQEQSVLNPLRPGRTGFAGIGSDPSSIEVVAADVWDYMGNLSVIIVHIDPWPVYSSIVPITSEDGLGVTLTNPQHVHMETVFNATPGVTVIEDFVSPLRYAFNDAPWNVLGNPEITSTKLQIYFDAGGNYVDFMFDARVNALASSFPLGIGGCTIDVLSVGSAFDVVVDFRTYLSQDFREYFLERTTTGTAIKYKFRWTDMPPNFDPSEVETVKVDIWNSKLTGYATKTFTIGDLNPVSFVRDCRYTNGTVSWTVLHEWRTREYLIEGCDSLDDEGTVIAREGIGALEHNVRVPVNGFEWFRLIEIEESGSRTVLAHCEAREPQARAWRPMTNRRVEARKLNGESRLEDPATPSQSSPEIAHPTCLVYTTPDLVGVLQSEFADYWNAKGHSVQIVEMPLSLDDDGARDWVRDNIRSYAANEGTGTFHLVSDWADDFTSSLWSSSPYWQSKLDAYSGSGWFPTTPPDNSHKVPPFLLDDHERDYENTARMHPYVYSDRPYADVDDDGIPDVVVTRWPLSSPTDVAIVCENMQNHHDQPEPLAALLKHATFLGGDVSGAFKDRQAIHSVSESLSNLVSQSWVGAAVTMIYESDAGYWEQRNAAVRENLNLAKPDLVTVLSTASSVDNPGHFFTKGDTLGGVVSESSWDMSDIDPDWFISVVIAASCQAALWVPFDRYEFRWSFPEFLTVPDRGAAAWIGPTTGSYQSENFLVAQKLIEKLCASPYRSSATSWLIAMQEAYAEAIDLLTLDSYVFLGNPLSTFARAPARTLEAIVKKAGPGVNLLPNSENPAVGCPQGDLDDLIIKIVVDAEAIGPNLTAEDIVISQPATPDVAFFGAGNDIHADDTPEYVTALSPFYRATVTIGAFSGCGEVSVPVSVRGIPLGYVKVNLKSPDMVLLPVGSESSRGKVILSDFAKFAGHYPSSACDCVETKTYLSCADFVMPDTTVNTPDFAFFSSHYQHEFSAQARAVSALESVSQGALRLVIEEDQPLIGQHRIRVYVRLENMEPFSTAMIGVRNDNELLHFAGWTPDPSVQGVAMCAEVTRDGSRQVFVGVLMDEALPSGEVPLGMAEFSVESSEPLQLTDRDFELVIGDVLASPGAIAKSSAQYTLSLAGRELTVIPPTYQNALAQNYPNPFNPTTTIVFSLAKTVGADLRIYDVTGAAVRTLVNGQRQAGLHRVEWDGRNGNGQPVASGVYFYKLVAGSFTDTKKMTILK